MGFMTSQKKSELLNEEFLIENNEKILSIREYLPFILRSFLKEINLNYSHNIKDKSIQKEYTRRKKVYSKFYNQNKGELVHLSEILCFIFKFPEFEQIIKDDDVLEDWIEYCERNYNVDIFEYSLNYEDIEKLLKKGE